MSDQPPDHRFRFSVLGRYPARLRGNEPAITLKVLAGHGDHLAYAGTLTMTEAEWASFAEAIQQALGDRVEIDDRMPPRREQRI